MSVIRNFFSKLKWIYIHPIFRRKLIVKRLKYFHLEKYALPFITVSGLKRYKTSDTLFILAAGQTINNLSKEDFDVICNHDSIGINGFAYHNFVPTYHSFELENQHSNVALEMFIGTSRNIIAHKEKYGKTAIVFRPNFISCDELDANLREIMCFGNSYWSTYDHIPGDTIESYGWYLKKAYQNGLFEKDDFFPNKSSSLSWVISVAYQLRYEKIVICGVDLVGDHFYNNPSPVTWESYSERKNSKHLTGDRTKSGVVVQDLLKHWKDEYFANYGAKLFVSSKFSLLSDFLPVYKF